MLTIAVDVVAGLFYAAMLEWSIHRFLFHRLGRRRGSPFAFHWGEHHRASRKHDGLDPAFDGALGWNAYGREAVGLLLLLVLHAPLALLRPAFFAALVGYGALYHYVHRKSHRDVEWARRWVPWHVEHHLGRDQDANFGVVTDLIDRLMGTRVPQEEVGRERAA